MKVTLYRKVNGITEAKEFLAAKAAEMIRRGWLKDAPAEKALKPKRKGKKAKSNDVE